VKDVECEVCHKQKITLHQIDCDAGDSPCYLGCKEVKFRAKVDVELSLSLKKNPAGEDVIGGGWHAHIDGADTVPGNDEWHGVNICVEAWKAKLDKHPPGTEIKVGTVTVTVKQNV
jgi:hypothetical protein